MSRIVSGLHINRKRPSEMILSGPCSKQACFAPHGQLQFVATASGGSSSSQEHGGQALEYSMPGSSNSPQPGLYNLE